MKWIKFTAGLLLIGGMAVFFASGYTPPGILGEVVRHNQQNDIDASPFFYGDVENFSEILTGAEQMYTQRRLHMSKE
ncbi:MAG: hypothetical protein ABIE07_08320 [Candidatus Zixiibacteriota bacterium]